MFNWRAALHKQHIKTALGILTGTLCGATLILNIKRRSSTLKNQQAGTTSTEKELKVYTREEVAAYDCLETGVWVTYQGKVYDITEFLDSHPGGHDKLLLSAGGGLEAYWSFYPVHKENTVLNILEQYCIGRLDVEDDTAQETLLDDPYHNDPKRHPRLLESKHAKKPFRALVPVDLLIKHYITPNELHYVRNHMPVPEINEEDYQLTLSGKGVRDVSFSIKDLKEKFKKRTVVATLQCAGNREMPIREFKSFSVARSIKGPGFISTAEWSGVFLKDILEYAGLDDEVTELLGIEHIQFESLEYDGTETSYGVSIPINKAMDPKGDVLLAYEMNGEHLPADHGYPVRVLVPGVVGCRSVKWLGKIIVSDKESDSVWQQKKYKISPLHCGVDYLSPAIQEFPVTSSVCYPQDNHSFSRQHHDSIPIKGYACSGGGRSIIRVDVSIDGGKTWRTANLKRREQPPGRQWAWSLWECEVPIPVGVDRLQIVCKAVDSSYNVQPETVAPIWNHGGYLMTAWSRVNVIVED